MLHVQKQLPKDHYPLPDPRRFRNSPRESIFATKLGRAALLPQSWWTVAVLMMWLASILFLTPGPLCAEPFDFADFVAETNLRPAAAFDQETFSEGEDSIDRFNGALSYTVPLGSAYPVSGLLSYQIKLIYTSNIWHFDATPEHTTAKPGERFNAGLGWSLSFGELLAPATEANPTNFWIYVDPEGRRTRFYATFDEASSSSPGTFYSRNGSYRRLQLEGKSATVESPNGLKSTFWPFEGGPIKDAWRLVSISDPLANFLAIDYSLADRWTLTDSHGRVHTVYLRTDPAAAYAQLIDRVEVAAFDDTVATYRLVYQTASIARPRQDDDAATPAWSTLPLLKRVEAPLGNPTVFSYHLPTQAEDIRSGRLFQVRLPTLGKIRYWYQDVMLPWLAGAEHAADAVGVWRRRTFRIDGSLIGTWRLLQSLDIPRVVGAVDQPRELTRRFIDPDGYERLFKFSVYVSGDSANDQQPPAHFEISDYGLPFTKNGARSADSPFLSTQRLDLSGSTLESTSVLYAKEPCAGCWDFRPRFLETRQSRYESGGDWTLITTLSDFDGLGHDRRSTSTDELGGPISGGSAPSRTIFTDYLGQRPDPTAPWILGVNRGRTVTEGGESKIEEFCVDPQTGLRLRQRVWAADQRGAHDLLRVYEHDGGGHLSVTRYYGGDTQALATVYSDLCSMALPAHESYAAFNDYQYGVLSRSGWLAADGSVFLVTREATIDRNTGLVTGASDGDGLWTHHAYDALGRRTLTTAPTGHGASSTHTYISADLATQSPAEFHSIEVDSAGAVLAEARTLSDGFGRPTLISGQSVNGWSDLVTAYDAMGRILSVTRPDGTTMSFTARDAYGRPLAVEHPGGSIFSETFSYGPRSTSRTVLIGKRWDEINDAVELLARTTTTTEDRHGRRVSRRVEDSDGDWRLETSTFNLAGQAAATSVTDGVLTSSTTFPERRDGRGLLIENAAGDPIFGYDALGKLTVQDTPNGLVADVFDRAGRLIERREGSVTGPLWLRNTYASSNGAGDHRQGKLWTSLRRNYNVPHMVDGRVDVEETYTYGGDSGRLSEVTTRVTAGIGGSLELFTFKASQSFTASGQLQELAYPDCVANPGQPAALCTPLPERHVSYAYDFGALTRVDGTLGAGGPESWIQSITYDLSGMASEKILGNGTVETRTPHISGAGRLADLSISHPLHGTFYTSGLAEYDGNGKLVKLGSQRRISNNAYSLELAPAPAATGNPAPPPPVFYGDLLGQSPGRSYRIPSRNAAFSSDGVEDVWEIHVYGPRGRLWTRKFNDFDAWNYNRSRDEWLLLDATGRKVRTRVGSTHYQGLHQVTYVNAQAAELKIYAALERHADAIYAGSTLIARTDSIPSSPWRTFYHQDIHGHTFASTDDEGEAQIHRAPIQ